MENYIVPGVVFLLFLTTLIIVALYPKYGDKMKFWKPDIQKEWDALYAHISKKPQEVLTTCERPSAGPDSPLHLRRTVHADMKLSGGIPTDALTLCGISLDKGWDRMIVDNEYLTAAWQRRKEEWKPGSVCPLCLDEVADLVITDESLTSRSDDV